MLKRSVGTVWKRLRNRTRFFRTYSLFELLYAEAASFSQFGEDSVLQRCFFPDQAMGFYVDVGAFHPFAGSNTHAFYRRGWRGINIEPNPHSFRRFPRYRPRDINLNLAISTEESMVEFTADSVFSKIADASPLRPDQNPEAQKITVKARPLSSVLTEHVPPAVQIEFMSIDCEGHDLKVLKSNDWERFCPRVVLVEDFDSGEMTAIDEQMKQLGYRFFAQLELTKIFAKEAGQRGGR